MTIEADRKMGGYNAHCDGKHCDKELDLRKCDDFHEAVTELKSQSWRLRKVDGEWCHFCPECQDE